MVVVDGDGLCTIEWELAAHSFGVSHCRVL